VGGVSSPSPAIVLTKKDFGRVLTIWRETAGLTVRDLARKADVPSGTVSGWCTGRHLPTLSQKVMFLRLLATCGVTDDVEIQEWVACWLRLRRPLGQQVAEAPTPYRGLEPFQAEHADWFFGRSRLTETLVRRVTTGLPGLVIVVGPSGSGKSSVLRAGLMATLCGYAQAVDRWQGVLLTPGQHPISVLATQLAVVEDVAADIVEAELWTQPAHAAQRIRQRAAGHLLIVVDQLEEIFTACADTAEQAAFFAALRELSGPADDTLRSDDEVRVVASMRADFYPDALRWPLLAQGLQDNQVTVGPMTENELRQAIVEPARVAGMDFENGLTHVLLRDLAPAGAVRGAGDISALPLLSHALLATWEQGHRRTMTITDYTATGGIHGAIGQTADAVFADLTDAERALVRRLFLRLVHVGDNTPDTRRRVQLQELTGSPEDDHYAQTREVLGRYVDQRLVTADADGVEISHEALLQAWPRLRHWIDTDRSGHRLHRQLTEAAQEWHDAERDPDALYRGVRLDAAVDWVTSQDHSGELNQLEQQFVEASVQAYRAERLRERRRTRRLRWLAAALGVLVLLSGATTIYSIQQRATADRERNLAISRQVAGTANRLRDSDPALAAQLAVAAYRIAPTVEARSSVLSASGSPTVTRMLRPSGALQFVALNPAGTLLAAAGAARSDTTVLLWDLRDPNRPALLGSPLTGHTAEIWAVAFSSDGNTLATGSADHTVRLWNVADAAHPKPIGGPLTGPEDEILAVEFSPDGSTLAVGSRDKTLRLWDVHDREHPVTTGAPLTGAAGEVRSVAFAPTGNLLAIADEQKAVRIWDLADRQHPRPLRAPLAMSSRVNTVAFSPDGMTLAAGSNDGSVRLWTMTDPAQPTPAGQLTRETGWINAIAFSANGKMLAAASANASVQVWDLTRHALQLDLPHAEPVTTVAFREQDQALYTNGADGIARRWLVPGPVLPTAARQVTGLDFHPHRPLLVTGGTDLQLWDVTNRNRPMPVGPALTAPPDSDRLTGTVVINPDGHTVAAATRAGNNVLLWDITTPEHPSQQPIRLSGHTAQIKHVAFNRRGDLLASTSEDGTVRLWNIKDVRNLPAPIVLNPGIGFIFAAEFSLNDQLLIAVAQNGNIALWDVRDPQHPTAIGKPIAVALDDARSLAISPDSRTLAIGIADGTVRLWDIENPSAPTQLQRPITGPDGYIQSLMFNPDGSILAGGAAGQTWLWNVTDRRQPHTLTILQTPKTITWKLQFSPDGQTLAAADGNIHLWDIDPEHVFQGICASAGDKITESEWEKHIPDAIYQSTCP
jgi:WD40 repeat protein